MNRHFVFGLLLAPLVAVLGFSSPAQAESEPSQCQSFEASLIRYNDRISSGADEFTDRRQIAESLLVDLSIESAALERETFMDATLRSLHQQLLGYVRAGRDNIATHLYATDQGEEAEAETAFGELQLLPYQVSEVIQQFEQYCNR
ncbi:MAG: hypothetical protein MUF49_12965 [Oculatellaceae cyanobacterium Prado106]|jgi:hypothetical protein|nr:hypothetical protein [Oculatellaceae cyanobacterium Prado106]